MNQSAAIPARPPETPGGMTDDMIRANLDRIELECWEGDQKFLREHRARKITYPVLNDLEDLPATMRGRVPDYLSGVRESRKTSEWHRQLAFERAWKEFYKAGGRP